MAAKSSAPSGSKRLMPERRSHDQSHGAKRQDSEQAIHHPLITHHHGRGFSSAEEKSPSDDPRRPNWRENKAAGGRGGPELEPGMEGGCNAFGSPFPHRAAVVSLPSYPEVKARGASPHGRALLPLAPRGGSGSSRPPSAPLLSAMCDANAVARFAFRAVTVPALRPALLPAVMTAWAKAAPDHSTSAKPMDANKTRVICGSPSASAICSALSGRVGPSIFGPASLTGQE